MREFNLDFTITTIQDDRDSSWTGDPTNWVMVLFKRKFKGHVLVLEGSHPCRLMGFGVDQLDKGRTDISTLWIGKSSFENWNWET